MKNRSTDQSSKLDRKTIERNRRNHMKQLCSKLASTIPSQHFQTPKDILSQHDQLDVAACYIKKMRERIEKLKEIKEEAMKSSSSSTKNNNNNTMDVDHTRNTKMLPLVELRDLDSGIEVVLITGLQKNFMLYEVITILEQEGAEVVSASLSTVGDKVFHTLHAQVKISRVGVETTRVWQRLQDLVY